MLGSTLLAMQNGSWRKRAVAIHTRQEAEGKADVSWTGWLAFSLNHPPNVKHHFWPLWVVRGMLFCGLVAVSPVNGRFTHSVVLLTGVPFCSGSGSTLNPKP